MTTSNTPIAAFLHNIERDAAALDIAARVAQFSDPFLAAGPQGAQCVRASDFALALPKRKQLFDNLGHQSTSLASCDEIRLDSRFVLARTRWQMSFAPAGQPVKDLLVDSTYLIDIAAEPFRIVLYLAHQDIMAVLKSEGLLPA